MEPCRPVHGADGMKDYLAQKKAGIKDPVFKASVLENKDGVEVWKD